MWQGRGVTSRQRWFLRLFALWTFFVWGTRIRNVIGDTSRGFAFKAVHVALAVISVGFAIGTLVISVRATKRSAAIGIAAGDTATVKAP